MGNCVWETTPSDEWEHILYIHIYIYTVHKNNGFSIGFPSAPCDFHWRLVQITEIAR